MAQHHTRSTWSRRRFLSAAAAGAAVPIISSCAGGSGGSGGGSGGGGMDQVDSRPPKEYRDRKHTIVLWSAFTENNGKVESSLIKKFNESQDEIYAEVQFQGNYAESSQKLSTALRAGKVPDVMILADSYWGRYLLNDLLEPLDDYFDDDYSSDIFHPEFADQGMAGDKFWWSSFARSTPVFYYNKELFAKAGLPDRAPETWTELREWGTELGKIKVKGKPLKTHAFTSADDWQFMAAIWEFGGSMSDDLEVKIDQGAAVECAEWQHRFIFDDGMAYMSDDYTADFGTGIVATVMASTGGMRNIYDISKFDVGVGPLPQEKAPGVPTGGSGWTILKGIPQERKDAGAEVIKFLARPENAAEWAVGTGYLPVTTAAVDEQVMQDAIAEDPNVSVAIDQLPTAKRPDAIRRFVANSTEDIIAAMQTIYSTRNANVQNVLTGVAEKLRTGAEDIEDEYNKYY